MEITIEDFQKIERRRRLPPGQHWIEIKIGRPFTPIPGLPPPVVLLGYDVEQRSWSVKTRFPSGGYDSRVNILADSDAPGTVNTGDPLAKAMSGSFDAALAKAAKLGIERIERWYRQDPLARRRW